MKNHPQFLKDVEVLAGPFESQDEACEKQCEIEDAGEERSIDTWQGYDRQFYVITREHLPTLTTENHTAVYCRQCGFELGDPYSLADHTPGDKPQEWGYVPENVDWFCASHAKDLGVPELAEQDEAIWLSK